MWRCTNVKVQGQVVVVAGFQGTSSGVGGVAEITTLGRGGSDTSAVALAAALNAEACEIYTDVPGVLSTDPRKVADAQLMDEISCDEMLELASLGASVLHPRAVEIARNYGVLMVVRSGWGEAPGTRPPSRRGRRPDHAGRAPERVVLVLPRSWRDRRDHLPQQRLDGVQVARRRECGGGGRPSGEE